MKINRFIALAAIALLVVGAMGFITARGLAYGANSHLQQVVVTQAPDTDNVEEQVGDQSGADTDTDNVEEQVGDQSAADTGTTNSGEQVSTPGVADTGTTNVGVQASVPGVAAMGTTNVGVQASAPGTIIAETSSVGEQASAPTTIITDTTNVDEQAGAPDTGVQDPSYTGSIALDQSQTEGMSEADESAALQGKATISAADAEAAALAANPGATVIKTELGDENGVLVYSVELSNGSDVKVDAGNGSILFTDNGGDGEY